MDPARGRIWADCSGKWERKRAVHRTVCSLISMGRRPQWRACQAPGRSLVDRESGPCVAHGIHGHSREPCWYRGIALGWPRRAAARTCQLSAGRCGVIFRWPPADLGCTCGGPFMPSRDGTDNGERSKGTRYLRPSVSLANPGGRADGWTWWWRSAAPRCRGWQRLSGWAHPSQVVVSLSAPAMSAVNSAWRRAMPSRTISRWAWMSCSTRWRISTARRWCAASGGKTMGSWPIRDLLRLVTVLWPTCLVRRSRMAGCSR